MRATALIAAAVAGAALLGAVSGYLLLYSEVSPPKELDAEAGLAYLRLRPVEVVNDAVMGNGTIIYYIAEVVIINNEARDGLLLDRVWLSLPSEVYVESTDCAEGQPNITITTVPDTLVLSPVAVSEVCMSPINRMGRISGGYLAVGDLLKGEGARTLAGSMDYYVPPGHELHLIVSGAVFWPEPVDDVVQRLSRGYVLALLEVSGRGYEVRGYFRDAVVINATLTEAPGGAYYFIGPYDNLIAGSTQASAIFPRREG